jgi:hypothetical protein
MKHVPTRILNGQVVKTCTVCHEEKPLIASFYPRRDRPNNYASQCKECTKKDVRKRQTTEAWRAHERQAYQEHREQILIRAKQSHQRHRAKHLIAMRQYYDKHREELNAHDRERAKSPERKEAAKTYYDTHRKTIQQQDYERYHHGSKKDIWRAHYAVSRAVKNGILQSQPCSRCAHTPAVAHHEDYTKPLEVVWLCRNHHGERHRELRKAHNDKP